MFWGILGYYRKFPFPFPFFSFPCLCERYTEDYVGWLFATQFLLLTIQLINDFAAPVATQRLLSYLESTRNGNGGGEKKSEFLIRPWVWILWLMLGPVWSAFAQQGVYYLVVRPFPSPSYEFIPFLLISNLVGFVDDRVRSDGSYADAVGFRTYASREGWESYEYYEGSRGGR